MSKSLKQQANELSRAADSMGKVINSERKAKPAATPELAKISKLRGQRKAKQTADTIIVVKGLATGNGTYVESANGKNLILQPYQDNGKSRKLAVIGGSMAALRAHVATLPKPQARLAHGVEARQAPHSAKAIADQHKGTKAAKAAAPKAAKAKQPSAGTNRPYTAGKTKNTAKADSWRGHMLNTIMGSKDTDSAKAKHAKSGKFSDKKLDFNWAAAQGYISWAK